MLTIKSTPEKSVQLVQEVYNKPLGYEYNDDYIMTDLFPFLCNKKVLSVYQTNKIIIILAENRKLILTSLDNWETINFVEKYDKDIVNRCYILNQDKEVEIKSFNAFYITEYLKFNSETINNKNLTQLTRLWKILTVEAVLCALACMRYVAEYQEDQLSQSVITVDINKFRSYRQSKQKEIKNKREEHKKKKESKSISQKPAKKKVLENSEDKDEKIIFLTAQCARMESDANKFMHLYKEEKNKNKELLAELEQLKKENKKLILNAHYNKEETPSANKEKTASEEVMKAALANKKILIIGGHDNWFRRLSEYLPDCEFIFIGVEEYTKKLSLSDNVDLIFFFTNHVDHCIYNRHLDYIRLHGYSYEYINTTNLEKNLEQMYKFLQKKKNGTENN